MIIVAVLLANSVNKAMTIVMRMTATGGGTPSKGCRRPPIQTDKPDSCRRGEQRSWRALLLRPCRWTDPLLELQITYNLHKHLCPVSLGYLTASSLKGVARSLNLLSYLLPIVVTWSWETSPSSVVTPQMQISQSQMRTPSAPWQNPTLLGRMTATWLLWQASPHSPSPWQSLLQAARWCSRALSLGPSSKSARAASQCLVLDKEKTLMSNMHRKRSTSVIIWLNDITSLTSVLKLTNHELLIKYTYGVS